MPMYGINYFSEIQRQAVNGGTAFGFRLKSKDRNADYLERVIR